MKHNFSPAEREYYSAPQLLSEPRARICYPTMSGHMANPSGWYLRSEVWQTDQLSCEILLFLFLFFFQSRIISMQPSSVFYCISILLLFFLGIDYCSNRHKKKSSALHQYQPLFPISLKFCCLSSHLCMLSEKKKKKKTLPPQQTRIPRSIVEAPQIFPPWTPGLSAEKKKQSADTPFRERRPPWMHKAGSLVYLNNHSQTCFQLPCNLYCSTPMFQASWSFLFLEMATCFYPKKEAVICKQEKKWTPFNLSLLPAITSALLPCVHFAMAPS